MDDPNTTRPFNNVEFPNTNTNTKKEFIKIDRLNPKETNSDILTSAVVKCGNITTEWMNGKNSHSFSYLTNPISMRDKYYYILKTKTNAFEMQIRYENNYLGSLDTITLGNFLNEVNSKDLPKYHKLYIDEVKFYRYIIIGFGMLMILVGFVIACLLMAFVVPSILAFLSVFMFLGILFILWGLYWKFTLDRRSDLKFYQLKYKEYVEIIDKWNSEHFSRMDVHCTTVQDLSYIQFTNINQRIVVQPHAFPEELVHPINGEALYVDPQSNININSGNEVTTHRL
jgi:hypothetical protein